MKLIVFFAIPLACGVALIALLSLPLGGHAAIGPLLDPWDGLYRTARASGHPERQDVRLTDLEGGVKVVRDERGVPHIFASSARDAITALGYVTAQDRLFQMDFVAGVAAGRLSEVLGSSAARTDRFMRSIGMDWGARRNAARIESAAGVEKDLSTWYCSGVNAYLETLDDLDLPLEFRILGYEPDECTVLQMARVLQFMSYDLTFRTDDARYEKLRQVLDPTEYAELFPLHASINEPITPREGDRAAESQSAGAMAQSSDAMARFVSTESVIGKLDEEYASAKRLSGFGFEHGKGSNNWAVHGSRSTTGAPILAGDMHLRLSLPAIWYEVHIVTPSMNVYGVTIPGAPLPIEAFNANLAWAFTNTGSDQIDHVALDVEPGADGYRVDGEVRPFDIVLDTIRVRGAPALVDSLLYSEWGPVVRVDGEALALRWVAHDSSRTLHAVWDMVHAQSLEEFDSGLQSWDHPMQNVLYADVAGNIAIRSTGYLPIRRDGDGIGVLDGTRGGPIWIGRVPFRELPHARNPAQGYLASANQQPVGAPYPYYMGHDWRRTYRGLRINELLRSKERHSVENLKSYQADVLAVQGRDFSALLGATTCDDEQAEQARSRLASWTAETTTGDRLALLFDEWLRSLRDMTWDEEPFAVMKPYTAQLYQLLRGNISGKWVDRLSTAEIEVVSDLLCASLAEAGRAYDTYATAEWGDHHRVVFSHLLRSEALSALSRGPFPYPGYSETLSPGNGRTVVHSASWRMVVDLSTSPPTAFGVYPGGASGDPLDQNYDAYVDTYLQFDHYRLENPSEPAYFDGRPIKTLTLSPATP